MPSITTNDISTYYEIKGKGKPLVLIHGAWSNSSRLHPFVDYFSRNHKVIVYDVRGHGKTGGSAVKNYSADLWANDLKALLDALSIKQPIICGLSIGSIIAQTYAEKYDPAAIILTNVPSSISLTLSIKVQKILFSKPLILGIFHMLGLKRFSNAFLALSRIIYGKSLTNKEILDSLNERMQRFEKNEFKKIMLASYDNRMIDYSKISAPSLIISGEHESKQLTSKLKKLIENSSEVIIPGTGHMSVYENTKEFNTSVKNFLDSISRNS